MYNTFNRSVRKTKMNEESSTSHFVFTLQISGSNKVNQILHSLSEANVFICYKKSMFLLSLLF